MQRRLLLCGGCRKLAPLCLYRQSRGRRSVTSSQGIACGSCPAQGVIWWVPGHASIVGNDVADAEAGAAAVGAATLKGRTTAATTTTLAHTGRRAKERGGEGW